MNTAAFGKAIENVRKHRDIKFVILFSIRTKLSYNIFGKFISNKNQKNTNIHELTCRFRSIIIRNT